MDLGGEMKMMMMGGRNHGRNGFGWRTEDDDDDDDGWKKPRKKSIWVGKAEKEADDGEGYFGHKRLVPSSSMWNKHIPLGFHLVLICSILSHAKPWDTNPCSCLFCSIPPTKRTLRDYAKDLNYLLCLIRSDFGSFRLFVFFKHLEALNTEIDLKQSVATYNLKSEIVSLTTPLKSVAQTLSQHHSNLFHAAQVRRSANRSLLKSRSDLSDLHGWKANLKFETR